MDNPRKIAMLAVALAVLGLGGLAWTGNLGQASSGEAQHDGHGEDSHGHADEQAGEDHEDEAGQLHLSDAQIKAAGVQLAAAGPRELGTAINFPGEIRFD